MVSESGTLEGISAALNDYLKLVVINVMSDQ